MRLTPPALLCLLALVVALPAQEPDKRPKSLERLAFRNIGPASGGRVCRAVGVPGDPLTYYAATAAGGLWKSTDGGFRWKAVMDDMPTSTIGCVAVAPSDPNVVYAGSGEANIRGNVEVGNGIYRSTDAGKTWKHVWKNEGQIGTLVVHPTKPDVAYAAVLGKAFGPSENRGVYRTTDGGATWKKVLFRNADTGAIDVVFDPTNPRILLAALWQTRRKPWELTSGGPGSGLFLSRDGGDTWTQLAAPPKDEDDDTKPVPPKDAVGVTAAVTGKGLPSGIWGRIGLAWAPSDRKRVYALIEAEEGGLFRSDDAGATWDRVSKSKVLRQRPWYFSTLTVHPTNADVVWAPQVPMMKSADGGKTFSRIKGFHHGDHHDVWIDPKNPDRMIAANDGGVDISTDGGANWIAPPLPIAQFYHIDTDSRVPYHVAGTMQDLGTAMGPSRSLNGGSISLGEWHTVGGGEAGHVAIDPGDHNIVYAGEYGGYISRYDHRTRQAKNVGIYPYNPSGHGAEDLRYRFQWTAPILISPHDREMIYHAGNVLFATKDGGQTWKTLSGDLTRNDKSKQKWSGGPLTGDNTGVEIYGTIFAVAESPKQKGMIWAGSDDGLVHVSPDGGATWRNVTAALTKAGLPEWGTVLCIEPSRAEAGTAYVVVDAHRIDDRAPYLFVTRDAGKTWKRLAEKGPDVGFLCVVREDPKDANILYLGAEKGLLLSRDSGVTWEEFRLNLPTVRITDIKVKGDDLVVGTNGRAIWIFDDLAAVRTPPEKLAGKGPHLYPVAPAYRFRQAGGGRPTLPGTTFDNPKGGATIHYFLPERAKDELTLEIRDAKGDVVRAYSSKKKESDHRAEEGGEDDEEPLLPKAKGLHRFAWDLRTDGAEGIANGRVDAGEPRQGYLVPPGIYTIRLKVGDVVKTAEVEVKRDPRVKETPGEAEQAKRLARIRGEITSLTKAVEALRSIKQQIVAREKLLAEDKKAESVVKAGKELVKKLDALEERFHNPKAEVTYDILAMKGGAKLYSQLVWLYEQLKDADGAPPEGVVTVHEEQTKELTGLLAEWRSLVEKDVKALQDAATKAGVPVIVVK